MKSYFSILVFFSLAITGYSQKVSIPKRANRIEVAATLSDSALLDIISFRLETAGFFIDQFDKTKGYLITEYKKMSDAADATSLKVIVQVKDNIAIFSGQGNAEVLGYTYTNVPLSYKGSGSGVEKAGFVALDETVKKLSKTIGFSSISYITPQPSTP